MKPYYEQDGIVIYHGDCREVLPSLAWLSASIVADPPYGIGVADWDVLIPSDEWLPLARAIGPTAVFCGVRGLHDYSRPDWTAAWVRLASTQRMGRLRGFNNWEPILLYGVRSFPNDVISCPNTSRAEVDGHPSPKPERLMRELLARLGADVVVDPFMGSGTTLAAAFQTRRRAIGIEIEERYCEIAAKRLEAARAQQSLPLEQPA